MSDATLLKILITSVAGFAVLVVGGIAFAMTRGGPPQDRQQAETKKDFEPVAIPIKAVETPKPGPDLKLTPQVETPKPKPAPRQPKDSEPIKLPPAPKPKSEWPKPMEPVTIGDITIEPLFARVEDEETFVLLRLVNKSATLQFRMRPASAQFTFSDEHGNSYEEFSEQRWGGPFGPGGRRISIPQETGVSNGPYLNRPKNVYAVPPGEMGAFIFNLDRAVGAAKELRVSFLGLPFKSAKQHRIVIPITRK